MTKQVATSSVGEPSGKSACSQSETILGGFDLFIGELKTQLTEFGTEDTVLIGNCPHEVTEEEINSFFCGFATIVRLQQVTHKLLTTNVFIAQFDSTDSASRSKVLNTLSLNGKKILLLQPDAQHFVDRKNVVELNGLQEHSEEVIYDQMTTFGNVSFVLKTNTVTYVVFEEPSAVEASCRCEYLDQYPVTIRSVLDGSTGASIETCILEQIDQSSSLLVEEEEEDGQLNNFMQLLDMENLDDYLEADEKDKNCGSDKPLLEVGNEEIIMTEDENAAADEEEADVAAIEKEALQTPAKKPIDTVSVDDRTKRILKLRSSVLRLDDLPQLRVAVKKTVSKVIKVKSVKSGAEQANKIKKNDKEKHSIATHEQKKKHDDTTSSDTKKKKKKSKEHSVVKKKEKGQNYVEERGKQFDKPVKERKENQRSLDVGHEDKTENKVVFNLPEEKHEATKEHVKDETARSSTNSKKKNEDKGDKKEDPQPKAIPSANKQVKEIHQFSKQLFVQLTKLLPKQIESLSKIQKDVITSQNKNDETLDNKESILGSTARSKQRKPGPDIVAMKTHMENVKVAEEKKTKKSTKRILSDDDEKEELPTALVKNLDQPESIRTPLKKKKKSSDIRPDEGVDDKTLEEPEKDSEGVMEKTHQSSNVASAEQANKVSDSVPDISNTVEISQNESIADMESEDEQPLVIDEPQEKIEKPPVEENELKRACITLDARSANLLKGKTHDNNLLFLDLLPRLVVKVKRVSSSDFNVPKQDKTHVEKIKDHHHHHAKQPPKKVSFDAASIKRKEEKIEKPRKTNLDKIDSKFLPAGSKLKSKVKSKTDINHKKHLPVPDLPIELKTHLNTSFKIPKKNSNATSTASIDRNASELNCLHKEPGDKDTQRKRFQKERKSRDSSKQGRDWKQKRPNIPETPKEREPSPVYYFDSVHDEHSPSPQRIPPTPPQQSETTTSAIASRNENRRFEPQHRGGSQKPTFQEIWNIPQKKPEVWVQPPWETANAMGQEQHPLRDNSNRQNQPNESSRGGWSSEGPRTRGKQQRNTIDAGESWSPQGARQSKPTHTIDEGESWSPGPLNRNLAQDSPRDPPVCRSSSPHQVQLSNSISTGDMWDEGYSAPPQKQNQNDLVGNKDQESKLDLRASLDQSSLDRKSPERLKQRDRSRSPGQRRRSMDRSPSRRNHPGRKLSPDRKNMQPDRRRSSSHDRSAISRKTRSRSRSTEQQRRRSLDRWKPGTSRDRSPFGRRRRESPFRRSPPNRSKRGSCSPQRANLTLSSMDMWDEDKLSPRARIDSPRSTIQSGKNWDDDIIMPLRDRQLGSPPRLRDFLQDRRPYDQFPMDRIPSPNSERNRSLSRDGDRGRLQSGRRETSFDRGFQVADRRWSRDQSPGRRKRSRSRSPERWRRSPVRRRRGFGELSPSYQNSMEMEYWKAVEDQEMGNISPSRPDLYESTLESPERWSPRGERDPKERSWSPPAPKVGETSRQERSRIDSEELWANDPKPRYHAEEMQGAYSPSSALDAISSEDECDFSNPLRDHKKSFKPIPLKLLPRTQSPPEKRFKQRNDSCDSFDSIPSYKELDTNAHEKRNSSPDGKPLDSTAVASAKQDPVPDENLSPLPHSGPDEKKSVLENLKQRAERLKKLEEMKIARQKLLAQIKHTNVQQPTSETEPSTKHIEPQTVLDRCTIETEIPQKDLKMVLSKNLLATVNTLLNSVDSVHSKPPVPEPKPLQSMPPMPPMAMIPLCPPLPVDTAPPIPPLPAEAPPPPPPKEIATKFPLAESISSTTIPFASNAWPPFSPLLPVDVTKPPPQLVNPLLQSMEPPQQAESRQRFPEFPGNVPSQEFPGSPISPPKFVDRFQRHGPSRIPNKQIDLGHPEGNPFISEDFNSFNEQSFQQNVNRDPRPQPQNINAAPLGMVPPEENEFIRKGIHDFNERNFQQSGSRDPRQQGRQQQFQRFGGGVNRQQLEQNQQQRDPRQNHMGNIYGGNRGRGGRFNRNMGNRFNNFANNQGNRFNNNNHQRNNFNDSDGNFGDNAGGNNLNNNSGNNFNNNDPRNRFNNNRQNNFNNNFAGEDPSNFGNMNFDPDGDFGDNSEDNSFNNQGNQFGGNSGNFDNIFNSNSDSNFNEIFSGNNFNNGGNRFDNRNNQQQQRFNFQHQQRFNNNRFNNPQQQRFRQQNMMQRQQQLFDEGCFDMNALGDDGNDGDDANWDDLE